jgi:hypothetical protein
VSRRTAQHAWTWPAIDPDPLPRRAPAWREIDPAEHPIIAQINRIAGSAAEILGPVLWAVLILLLLWAEISAS